MIQTKKDAYNQVLQWFRTQLTAKNIAIDSFKDLKSGRLFLQTIHIYHQKYVDLSKVYIKPKNNFEVMQNYKQLMNCFHSLRWKKFEHEKYAKQQDKDCLSIATYIMKVLSAPNKEKKIIKNTEGIQTLFDKVDLTNSNENKNSQQDQEILLLQTKKRKLLQKIINIEHVALEATDTQTARNLINKILQAK